MIEFLRLINAVVWFVLLISLFAPMKKAVWSGGATPIERVLGVVWWLAFNRVCFVSVSQYTPDAEALLAFCYVFATAGGIAMILVSRSTRHG